MPMLPDARDYDALYSHFRWDIPVRYNISVSCCDRWAATEPDRLAILNVGKDGRQDKISYGWLRETSNRLANVLAAHGIARGDRVAIMLPQTPEVAAAHMAIYKLAAVALPIAILFGPDALLYRLQNSGAKALITNAQGADKLAEIRKDAPAIVCLSPDGASDGVGDLTNLLTRASSDFTPADTSPDDPALMIYTSGTTGQPNGARPSARRRDAALPIPLARRPALDAGRLGLGWWVARRSVAEPASRRAGGRASHRQVRPRRRLRTDAKCESAQRVHSADRVAHDARRAKPARPLCLQPAHRCFGW
jgi:hypothetical protein